MGLSPSAKALSRAECPGTCQSMEAVEPGPPTYGRRSVEGPGSSVNGALPLNPECDSREVQPLTKRKRGHNSGGL